ncbi:anti-sigma factor [Parablastomonas sp. CN1-191]|uniref:anti-sigma factor n=1 Tax=Parablastomonas sp. CN1-191 TaxID=3400908 RepID=UPI003BF885F0
MTAEERSAAEYVLGLLDGSELMAARRRHGEDAHYRALVEWWEDALAPLFDEIAEVEPGAALWARVEAAISGRDPGAEVLALRRRVRGWQLTSALAAAAAVVLALVALPRIAAPPVPPATTPVAPRAPLIAALALPGKAAPLALTFLPGSGELVVNAADHDPGRGKDDELWVIPAGGTPRSLGVVAAGTRRVALEPALARLLTDGATVAVTREAAGGSPTGLPQGPLLSSGKLGSA